jgi:hypothetical protein
MLQTEVPRSRIEGGFVSIPVSCLMRAWRLCRSKLLQRADFRTWLAIHEMRARRCSIDDRRAPGYFVDELARLLGGLSERRVRDSLGRLGAAGLVVFKPDLIQFPTAQEDEKLDVIGRGSGPLFIPRRLLRFLVNGQPVRIIATVLAVLLRCLSRRKAGWRGWGRLKSAWVASMFGISQRQAKAARAELIALGWLTPEPSLAWIERRYGRAFTVNLDWTAPTDRSAGALLTPQGPATGAILSPLDQTTIPLRDQRNQEPGGPGAGTGFRCGGRGNENTAQARTQAGTGPTPLPAPRLTDIRPEDLRDTARTLVLFGQAVERKLIGSSENDRLKFLALAEYACEIGQVNPGGLMASLMHRGAWHFATQAEEDAARRKLRDYQNRIVGRPLLFQSPGPVAPPPGPVAEPPPRPSRVSTFIPDGPASGPSTLSSILARFTGLS